MKVVIVDDQAANNEYVARVLRDHETHSFTDPLATEEFCRSAPFDILLADQKMPGLMGIDLIKRVKRHREDFIALVLSAYTDAEDLIDAINSRAVHGFLLKPFSPQQLREAVDRAGEFLELARRKRELERELLEVNRRLHVELESRAPSAPDHFGRFIGTHPKVQRIKQLAAAYAETNEPVLICGETGTGKELIAKGIHAASSRRDGPFVALNCSAFSPSLIESELFGHEQGAYTDARRQKMGLVEAADRGTLFLDEVGDFPKELQPKILRFLQSGTFIPVGSVRERRVDVRIVSATNRDLRGMLRTGLFREDLFFRLNTLELRIPPLRERKEDIPLLLEGCAATKGYTLPALPVQLLKLIRDYSFPGNVREIECFVARLTVHSSLKACDEDLDSVVRELVEASPWKSGGEGEATPLEDAERAFISDALTRYGSNITKTAEYLGMSRQGLRNKLRRMDLYHGK